MKCAEDSGSETGINVSSHNVELNLPHICGKDLLFDKEIQEKISMVPYGTVWLKKQ